MVKPDEVMRKPPDVMINPGEVNNFMASHEAARQRRPTKAW